MSFGSPIESAPPLEQPGGGTPESKPMPRPEEPNYYGPDGKMTREHMVAVIRNGGSVLLNGKLYWREQDLPTAVELAGEDEAKIARAADAIKAQISELQASLAGAEQLQVQVRLKKAERPSEATTEAPVASQPTPSDVAAAKARIEGSTDEGKKAQK